MDLILAYIRPKPQRPGHVEDGMSDSTLQQPGPPTTGRRPTVTAADDKLSIFRHMIGIHSKRSFATPLDVPDLKHNNLHFDGRAAPNVGIYNRVVHREQQAKRGYKFSAILINGCLGIQIIVAAALTAMGAANSGHVGITAFGAINTVIAGLLTYLKGSGLPNRLRYYENEWKKVREYIEQRERDFSRPECALDVHEVVRAIEAMYEDVKADIRTNTPDSYVSVAEVRNRFTATSPHVPKLNDLATTTSPHLNKLQELELKYGRRVADAMGSLAKKEEERVTQLEKGVEGVERSVEEKAKEAARVFETDLEMGKTRVLDAGKAMESDLEANTTRVFDAGKAMEHDLEAGVTRVSDATRHVERQAERERSNAARLRREVEDEIHHGQAP